MKSFVWIAFSFFISLATMPAAAAEPSSATDLTVKFRELRKEGDPNSNYVLAVIRPREPGDHSTPENRDLAQSLLKIANEWSVDIYRERYTHMPIEKYEEMRRKGIKLTY